MLMGTAMSRAMADETSVPKMNGTAPNCSLTGSQSLLTRKCQPNFCSAIFRHFLSCKRIVVAGDRSRDAFHFLGLAPLPDEILQDRGNGLALPRLTQRF